MPVVNTEIVNGIIPVEYVGVEVIVKLLTVTLFVKVFWPVKVWDEALRTSPVPVVGQDVRQKPLRQADVLVNVWKFCVADHVPVAVYCGVLVSAEPSP